MDTVSSPDSLPRRVSDRDILNVAGEQPVEREKLRQLYETARIHRNTVQDILGNGVAANNTQAFLEQRSFEDTLEERMQHRVAQSLDEFLQNVQEGSVVHLEYAIDGKTARVHARSRLYTYEGGVKKSLEEQVQLSSQRYTELFEFLGASTETTREQRGNMMVIGFTHMTGKRIAIALPATVLDEQVSAVTHFDEQVTAYKYRLERSRAQYERLLRAAYTPDKKLSLGALRGVMATLQETGVPVVKSLLQEAYGKALAEPMDAFFRLLSSFTRQETRTGVTWERLIGDVQRIFAKFPQLVKPLLRQVQQVFFPQPKAQVPSPEAQAWANTIATREQKTTHEVLPKSRFVPVRERRFVSPVVEETTKEAAQPAAQNLSTEGRVVFLKRATETLDPTMIGLSQKELLQRRKERDAFAQVQQQEQVVQPASKMQTAKPRSTTNVPAPIGVWQAPQEELFGGVQKAKEVVATGIETVKGWGAKVAAFGKRLFGNSQKK